MERPAPILWFSRYYLAAVVLKTGAALTLWSAARAGTVQVGLTIALLLWFGIVYRRSNIARWIALVLFVPGTLWLLLSLAQSRYPPVAIVLHVAATIFAAAAALQLIDARANAWFAARPSPAA
jgi:hypothetical protein